jgi:hypothetical protein
MRVIGLAVVLALSIALAPLAVEAQPTGKAASVGYLSVGSACDPRRIALTDAFRLGLGDLGYAEGRSINIEAIFSGGQLTIDSLISRPSWSG